MSGSHERTRPEAAERGVGEPPGDEAPVLPSGLRLFLTGPELAAVWPAIRARLERNGLQARGALRVELDPAAAAAMSGLLGRTVPAGPFRLRLDELDAALRGSSAAAGLVAVTAALGEPLTDRRSVRAAVTADRAALWSGVDAALATAGLAGARWAPEWVAGLRRSGTLTRAGTEAALAEVQVACRALALLAGSTAAHLAPAVSAPVATDTGIDAWEVAALASAAGGDAHALDGDRLASLLVLRAAAIADGVPLAPGTAGRRAAWSRLGVRPDLLSGTALVWNLRPPANDGWGAMMAARAELGLVTHLTAAELSGAAGPLVAAGTVVWCCENPQVMQAAARERARSPLVCLSGNPATVGVTLLRRLVQDGAQLRYHGDFDWPGIAIAARVFALGATPWRMTANEYRTAVAALPDGRALPLSGQPVRTDWDPPLAAAMTSTGVAVHEESLLERLLLDLR